MKLLDISQEAESSAQCNHVQIVENLDGTSKVTSMTGVFSLTLTKLEFKGISRMSYFRFTADHPRCVFNSDGVAKHVFKDASWRPSATDLWHLHPQVYNLRGSGTFIGKSGSFFRQYKGLSLSITIRTPMVDICCITNTVYNYIAFNINSLVYLKAIDSV